MRTRWHVFVVLLLASAGLARAQDGVRFKGPDHSVRGGEYAVLNNLLIRDAERVEYVGREQVSVYGKVYEAAKFVVHDWVRVTVSGSTECAYDHAVLQPCEAAKSAEIEVFVGLDEAGEVHDEMLRRVHAYWAANKIGRGTKAKAREHLVYGDGEYFMFQESPGDTDARRMAKRLIWVDGKFIRFRLKRFSLGDKYHDLMDLPLSKDEGLEHFVAKGIYVRPRTVRFEAKRMKGAFRDQFFSLYAGGAFNRGARRQPDGGR